MGTRGAIARLHEIVSGTWQGRYHHWDSYPTGLGETLWTTLHGHFNGDVEGMLKFLIDEHPAGWSTINHADFSQSAGYNEGGFRTTGPQCYCHGGRREKSWFVDNFNAARSGCEWAYVFDVGNRIMYVLSSYDRDGAKMVGMFGSGDPKSKWHVVKAVKLDGKEPNWQTIERRGSY